MMRIFLFTVLLFSFTFGQNMFLNPWQDASKNAVPARLEKMITVDNYRLLQLDRASLAAFLKTAPPEDIYNMGRTPVLELPMPDGNSAKFEIYNSPIMAPELAAKYPEINTYLGRAITPGYFSVRLDLTPQGFHAQVFSAEGTIFIDPYSRTVSDFYISYYKRDFTPSALKLALAGCETEGSEYSQTDGNNVNRAQGTKRTYRLALAATGEYTAFHGGTVAGALAAMTTTMNRVNGVYERDFSIRMIMVNNTNLLIYTNGGTDPYTNNNGSTMLQQNVNNCNSVIGAANYDIGHVFSTGGGGVAYLACVCTGSKAGGVTGSPQPVGDAFDIDYVAHEMGHQFGANHTQNNNCNRNASTAFEPGSASTIMGYAGICPPDLQQHSDDFFHIGSMVEIYNFINGNGNSCAVSSSNNNEKPVATIPAGGWTIPKSTPFKLTGSATDADNNTLTYCWEEYDIGPSAPPNNPSGNSPIFRSWNPETTPTRWFPKRSSVYNNTSVIGEFLPTYARNLKFRLTVRDNNPGGGNFDWKELTFAVSGTAGPFKVTYPNTNVSIAGGTPVTVTWDVSGTDAAPISASAVNIKITTDQGNTFLPVADNVPNNGSATVTFPDIQTSTARLYIEAANNIFYDVSDVNFTIMQGVPVEFSAFEANTVNGDVKLQWSTATETNNKGFSIERKFGNENFAEIGYVDGKGTTTETNNYFFNDRPTTIGSYTYRLKQIDLNGSFSYSNVVEVEITNPVEFSLQQNYPNPFNPSTSIAFSLPEAANVKITIYDVSGSKVADLVNGNFAAGWQNVNFDATKLNSGVYLYSISAVGVSGKTFAATKKMLLLK
ncbi:MAG: M12 family metallo-peptidase [Ignavibacteriales bacterium]|nr:MAG: T9SS type A sorting domain-containing protein [Ignavibacteriaceae bacterium]MBV6444901.1 hypothetical protein [Ignavibacteriaceae bacterium]MBZ0197076.1 T9SS type A sorting domain-containing protein [Ignavibacteriaceae bacterium]MCZ2142166.1 M12 family metallo-peptidase [Ignavibacteriales bacterium]WKZ71636.1 MAG: M12 family metallo-peptidase [Ignavibacteriaceae bacterium]